MNLLALEDCRASRALYRRLTWLFAIATLAGCLVGVAVPAGLGWDFANFYDAGRRVAAGQVRDLYDATALIGGQPPQGRMGFWGTPISAVLYAPMSWFSARTALTLFKIENVLALGVSFRLLFLFYRPFAAGSPVARWQFAALFTFLCLIYQPFWTVFRVGGQTTATVFLLLTLALAFHTSGRLWGSALCLVVATLIKPVLAPVLVWLLCVSGTAFLRKTAIILAACGVISVLLLGWPVHAAFLGRVLGGMRTIYPWHYNSSIYIVIANLRSAAGPEAETGFYPILFGGLTWAARATVLGTAIYLTVKGRSQPWPAAARRHFHFIMAIIFFLLWSLTLWEHYLAVLFLALAYVVASRQYFGRPALMIVSAIFVLSIGQNLILTDWLSAHFQFRSVLALVGIALFKSGPLLLTIVLFWMHYPEFFRSYAAPAWRRPLLLGGQS